MNIRKLTVVGVTLVALALPTAALAKGASVAPAETNHIAPGIIVVAQDSGTDKPKAEGWQTGEGDMSDDDCQAHANRVQEYRDLAVADVEAGDGWQGLFDLDMADMYEDAALDGGCAISYPS